MGAVGGLLGLNGGMGGTGYSAPSGTNGNQIQNSYGNVQNSMQSQQSLLNALQSQNGLGNQSQVYNQLQGVVAGQGPNPAQTMLNQATGQNVANQAALMAGQRGAAANPALIARQAAQQGANLQQQAAGQGASMQAQQSLGALGQAGQLATTQAGQQIGQTNANTQAQQNEQGILQNANTANNSIQGQLANTTLGGQQNLVGGAGNAAGAALKLGTGLFAEGGPVQGATAGPQSMFGQFVNNVQTQVPSFSSAPQKKGNFKPYEAKPVPLGQGAAAGDNQFAAPDKISMPVAAGGGEVTSMVSPGERFLKPGEAKAVAEGRVNAQQVGEKIPGQAPVKGDSYKNDIVKKDLEVGGIVLPRSVENSKNPGAAAKKFVDAYLSKKAKS